MDTCPKCSCLVNDNVCVMCGYKLKNISVNANYKTSSVFDIFDFIDNKASFENKNKDYKASKSLNSKKNTTQVKHENKDYDRKIYEQKKYEKSYKSSDLNKNITKETIDTVKVNKKDNRKDIPKKLVKSVFKILILRSFFPNKDLGFIIILLFIIALEIKGNLKYERKKLLRTNYLNIRNGFSNSYIDSVSKAISNKLFDIKQYKDCENIFIYLSTEKEINTYYIINQAKKDNKNIYCPVLTNKKQEMVFKKYSTNLIKNKFNILEPLYEKEKISDNKTLIIVPALIYNKDKYRIGYGGGYYDYFLKNNTYLASVGICFEKFISPFNQSFYDEKVDIVITEKNIY